MRGPELQHYPAQSGTRRRDLALTGCVDPTSETTCTASGFTRIYRSSGNPTNIPPAAPGGLQANITGNKVTLSWNAPAEAQTASLGFSYNLRGGTTLGGSNIVAPMANISTGYRRRNNRKRHCPLTLGRLEKKKARALSEPFLEPPLV